MSASFATKIGEATGMIGSLADIIAQYEGRYILKETFIGVAWRLLEEDGHGYHFLYGNGPAPDWAVGLRIRLMECGSFPFCRPCILDCPRCAFRVMYFESDIHDVILYCNQDHYMRSHINFPNLVSFDELLGFMINGGLSLTYPPLSIDKDLADRVDRHMSRAYEELCSGLSI